MTWKHSRGKREGAVAVEMAVLAPILLLMVIGLLDYAGAIQRSIRLEGAARVGVQTALADPSDLAGIRAATLAASDLEADITEITAERICTCGDGTVIDCGNVCADGRRVFVDVTVSQPYRTILPYPGLERDLTLSGSASFRAN